MYSWSTFPNTDSCNSVSDIVIQLCSLGDIIMFFGDRSIFCFSTSINVKGNDA